MTKTFARLLAPLLIAAGLTLGLQAVAEAHDNAVTIAPVCNHDTGMIDLTETVSNDYNLTEVLSNATRSQTQLNGKTVAKLGNVKAYESVPANGALITLTVHGRWSDGFAKDSSGSTRVPSECVKTEHVTVGASFVDQTCDGSTGVYTPGTYDAPAIDGTTETTTGDTNPGDTLTVTFTPNQYVVIDGASSFSHTYPSSPTVGTCKAPPPPKVHPKRGFIKTVTQQSCRLHQRGVYIWERHGVVAHRTHDAKRTEWAIHITAKPGFLVRAHQHGKGKLVKSATYYYHLKDLPIRGCDTGTS